ncbi:MAG: hypothetical protein OSB43_06255 [Nocardioides sp.]|uniref:hypothetical protein n=1 Tax=Nocardioides sp. TaxID=35761 RepID=UPI002396ABEF|nr:hypothetical protein [Nocardioides sp.]MDE0775853.1 hypothetical protein [Nocardioides sp.]
MSDDYYVVKVVTDYELLVNFGAPDGADAGLILKVLDPETQNVKDPKTGLELGSVEREKARIAIETVGDKMSLCRVVGRQPGGTLSAISTVMTGSQDPPTLIRGNYPKWPEGVKEGDPVALTGRRLKGKP